MGGKKGGREHARGRGRARPTRGGAGQGGARVRLGSAGSAGAAVRGDRRRARAGAGRASAGRGRGVVGPASGEAQLPARRARVRAGGGREPAVALLPGAPASFGRARGGRAGGARPPPLAGRPSRAVGESRVTAGSRGQSPGGGKQQREAAKVASRLSRGLADLHTPLLPAIADLLVFIVLRHPPTTSPRTNMQDRTKRAFI